MILMIDNYDSFTYNLVQYLGELGNPPQVIRNDERTVAEIETMHPSHIVISPGPGRPDDAGISKKVIEKLHAKLPILGVCLGHQCIGEVFGGAITYAPTLMHGKTSQIRHTGKGIFQNLPNPLTVTRYHSLVIDPNTLPGMLEVTAQTEDGIIMGVQHKTSPLHGVQFHPESILTQSGKELLRNFLNA